FVLLLQCIRMNRENDQLLRELCMNRILRFLRRFMLQKTIYRTFLVYYLLGNLLLLVLLGMLSIRDSTRMITEEVIRSSNKVMEQAAQGLSFNLEETKRSLLVLASNQS